MFGTISFARGRQSVAFQHHSYGFQGEPPSRRSACDQCRSYKVKCSGKPPKCLRCTNLGQACTFSQGSRRRQAVNREKSSDRSNDEAGVGDVAPDSACDQESASVRNRADHKSGRPPSQTLEWSHSSPLSPWPSIRRGDVDDQQCLSPVGEMQQLPVSEVSSPLSGHASPHSSALGRWSWSERSMTPNGLDRWFEPDVRRNSPISETLFTPEWNDDLLDMNTSFFCEPSNTPTPDLSCGSSATSLSAIPSPHTSVSPSALYETHQSPSPATTLSLGPLQEILSSTRGKNPRSHLCTCLQHLTSTLFNLNTVAYHPVPQASQELTASQVTIDRFLAVYKDCRGTWERVTRCVHNCLLCKEFTLLLVMIVEQLSQLLLGLSGQIEAGEEPRTDSRHESPAATLGRSDQVEQAMRVGEFVLDDPLDKRLVVGRLLQARRVCLNLFVKDLRERLLLAGFDECCARLDTLRVHLTRPVAR